MFVSSPVERTVSRIRRPKARKTSTRAMAAMSAAHSRIPPRSPSASGPSITCLTISGTATMPALDTIDEITMKVMWRW